MIVDCKIELPDGWELDGPLPRCPKKGEWYLGRYGDIVLSCCNFTDVKFFIIRQEWVWPPWLTAEWVFQTDVGVWFASNTKPVLRDGSWYLTENINLLNPHMLAFVPPQCTDWRTSLRRNPRSKQ